jgi:hypothetical protein
VFTAGLINLAAVLANAESAPLSAFVWWLIPLFAFIGAIGYVIWVSKFQAKYENETNRSVGRFQKFQQSLEGDRTLGSVRTTSPERSPESDRERPTNTQSSKY